MPDMEATRIVSGAEWRRRAEKAEEEVRLLTTLFDRRCAHIGELEAALRPFAAESPTPTQGLDSVGDEAVVELYVLFGGQEARFGMLKLGHLRRAAELVEGK